MSSKTYSIFAEIETKTQQRIAINSTKTNNKLIQDMNNLKTVWKRLSSTQLLEIWFHWASIRMEVMLLRRLLKLEMINRYMMYAKR